jgi:aspartate 1-decarboxylase
MIFALSRQDAKIEEAALFGAFEDWSMLLRTYLVGKIHGVRLTDKSVQYQGSITISRMFLEAAGIAEFEAVQVVNVNTGARLLTYTMLSEEPGVCILNGGAARLGEVGDKLIIMAFAQSEKPLKPKVVLVAADNHIIQVIPSDK